MGYDIKDIKLAAAGWARIEWASHYMPTIRILKERFREELPLEGLRIGGCLHVTTETANLVELLVTGGAEVYLCASNPLSTQDDVAAALTQRYHPLGKVHVYAFRGVDTSTYYQHIEAVLENSVDITIDDGADLTCAAHKKEDLSIFGGTEETTTGVTRLRNMAREGTLRFPIIAVNYAKTKFLFDNRYGTGQSTLDGILRLTNVLFAGMKVVVCGYGWCGRGIAQRARGMNAEVIVCEVDPIKALEAKLEGFRVLKLKEAAKEGDIFITATGNKNVIRKEHIKEMKSGAILCNAGHFNVEIELPALEELATNKRQVKPGVEEYTLDSNKRIILLAEGRLVNLVGAEGHPPGVMDMSFANQALAVKFLYHEKKKGGEYLKPGVYDMPRELDEEVSRLKLATLGIEIDSLTAEQKDYLQHWQEGTD
jgi:adenosylhomocysteinase